MTARAGATLYTPEILALAVSLAEFPLIDSLPLLGEAHSRVCGSRMALGVEVDAQGRIAKLGARVSACAIGQAAAALFLRGARGRSEADIGAAQTEIAAWLADAAAETPEWPGIVPLAPARAYPARHPAILLPWKAALDALSKRDAAA